MPMRKSLKATLLSLLVFPGIGHFVVRRWFRGLLFILPTLLACTFLFTYSLDRALDTVDMVLAGEVAPDTSSIEATLSAPPPEKQARLLSAATYLILACWLGAAIDAALLGHKYDKMTPSG
jgi:hypothetical protein